MNFKRVITVDDERQAQRAAKGLVSVVDDDVSILNALSDLIEYEGYVCDIHESASAFFERQNAPRFPGPRCILSDMSMPGEDGLALQIRLPADSDQVLIFMSGISGVEQAAQAFRNGALHFLTKPIQDHQLFSVVDEALKKSALIQQRNAWQDKQTARIAKLTVRERELAAMLPEGLSIKEMAEKMGVSDRAVKLYKKSLADKLEAKSLADVLKLQMSGLL